MPRITEQVHLTIIFHSQDARIGSEENYRDTLKYLKKGLMADRLPGWGPVHDAEEDHNAEG